MKKFYDQITEADAILRAIAEDDASLEEAAFVESDLGIYRPANGWLN